MTMVRTHQRGVWREVSPEASNDGSYAVFRTYELYLGRRTHSSATIWGDFIALTPKGVEVFGPDGTFGKRGWTVQQVYLDEPSFRWHTWDRTGTGGENASESTLPHAMYEAECALLRQGWW